MSDAAVASLQMGEGTNAIPAKELILGNLEQFTVEEIKQLSARANHVLIAKQSEVREQAYKECQAIASKVGLTLTELIKCVEEDKVKKKTVKPKYHNPNNPDEKWSGRGKRPTWLRLLIAAGAKIEDFEVN
ncbi:H-NS histone family protein [Alkanindiges hydrocarboniclasticus]|nr:H-NS histone family protein [Alkanindiges hydrocarboniclasticus]